MCANVVCAMDWVQTAVTSYEGGRSDAGLFHGEGAARFTSGQQYAGQWQLGHMHGAGWLRFPDGSSWRGGMRHSTMTGQGVSDHAGGLRATFPPAATQ